jgi:hypothetical protein
MIEGTYHASRVDKKDQATNYWWGIISGVVDLELSDGLSPYTKRLIGQLRQDIIDGRLDLFGRELDSKDIIMMDQLNENIIGDIPKIDVLKDEAKTTVKYGGVEKAKTK